MIERKAIKKNLMYYTAAASSIITLPSFLLQQVFN